MNRLKLFSIILLFACMSCVSTSPEKPTEESLLVAVETFNRAFSSGQIPTLVTMIADDYRHTNGNSKAIDTQSWLTYLHQRNKDLESKTLIVHDYKMDQIDVVLYEKAALVTGRVTTSVTYKGDHKVNEYRVTHLWVYENERWKRAGFHDGRIK